MTERTAGPRTWPGTLAPPAPQRPPLGAMAVEVSPGLVIPAGELEWRFSRSGGPGGQNVNKVETRVELLFSLANSTALPEETRQRLMDRLRSRLDEAGVLRVTASEHRTQSANRQAAALKLASLLQEALRPRRIRRPTAVPRGVREQRLQQKRYRSALKQQRGYRDED